MDHERTSRQEEGELGQVPAVGLDGVRRKSPFEVEMPRERLDQLGLSVGKLIRARHESST